MQVVPPLEGVGLAHCLFRDCVPLPHVTLHEVQLLQVVQLPSEIISSLIIDFVTVTEVS
jgi:hypothetical protein